MATRRQFLTTGAVGFPALVRARGAAADRMNVLWILGDDLGTELGCYGYRGVHTPNIDRLAGESARFTRFHTTAPVCSASRSAFNVGLYQTTTGTHNHRSHRQDGYQLPAGARLITDRFREQGYFTCNVLDIAEGVKGNGKTDFNFTAPKPFDGTHWNQRKPGQPFYGQVNFTAPHKGPAFVEARRQKALVDPAKVELPPYYPDHPVVRDEMANYLDAIQLLDRKVGVLLGKLKEENLLDNTAIFFFGDNGRCLLRGKQWLYGYGTNVPLLVRWPGVAKPGTVRDELCLSLDMTASSLMAGGMAIPEPFHGRPLLGAQARPRDFIVTARDRCDMTVERIRAVRDNRYRYIRNFMPERPRTQFNAYIQESYPTQRVIKELHASGKLNAIQDQWMAPHKPAVEFYDTQSDPFEVRNLADSPEHKKQVAAMAKRLDTWIAETQDKGGIAEPKEELDQWTAR